MIYFLKNASLSNDVFDIVIDSFFVSRSSLKGPNYKNVSLFIEICFGYEDFWFKVIFIATGGMN